MMKIENEGSLTQDFVFLAEYKWSLRHV